MFAALRDVEDLLGLVGALADVPVGVDDAALVDQLRALEAVKAACAAAQARAAAALDASIRAAREAAGVPAAERSAGVGAQVALARRESPHRGVLHLGSAKALVHEMPRTLAALTAGRLSEWRAMLLVRETACLTREDRAAVDARVAGDADALERLGDRALVAAAKPAAYALDPGSVVTRASKAAGERRVTMRPAPDTMAYLTALLPVADAVAAYAALERAATTAAGAEGGDPRSRGHVMADTLVTAVRGATGTTTRPAAADVAVQVVITDRALLDGDAEPATVAGYGPVPAAWARELVATALDAGTKAWLRRLFTSPTTGGLVGMDARARLAPAGLAALIRARDGGTCRTPWCDAPIRHVDHVQPHVRGGPTTAENLQGLCEACNHAKQAPGWHAEPVDRDDGPHEVRTTTPTGHAYDSTAPPLPGRPAKPEQPDGSPLEAHLRALLRAA